MLSELAEPVRLATAIPPGMPDTVRVADLFAAVLGLKAMPTVHLPPPGRAAMQPFAVMTKSALSVPPRAAVRAPVAASPVFVMLNVCDALMLPRLPLKA